MKDNIAQDFNKVAEDWKSAVINALFSAWNQFKDTPAGYVADGVALREDKDRGIITVGFMFRKEGN